jgi:hypothetical protein
MAALCTQCSIEQRSTGKVEQSGTLLDFGKSEAFIWAVERHLHLNAMREPTARELIVPELTVPEDWSLIRTNCCLSLRIRTMTNPNQQMKNVNSKTSCPPRMIQSRRSRKTMIQCCGRSHVAVSQSLRHCALGLHQDRRDAHFRRHHALGYEHSAD